MIPGVPMSTLLPEASRNALIAASKVDSRIDFGEEAPERIAAIEAAEAIARARSPELFQ